MVRARDDCLHILREPPAVTVLVSASGAPGTAALLRALRENGEREVRLVGTDMSERSVGRHLCDAFHLVPAGADRASPTRCSTSSSARASTSSCRSRRSTSKGSPAHRERFPAARCSSRRPDAIHRSNDKAETYAFLHRLGAARARRSGGSTARPRSTRPRASSATPTGRSASSRSSRRARAASACSTPRSTARTSSSRAARARWRCGSRRPSSCCPTRAAPTSS